MHPNAELITRFYGALAKLDGNTMAASYAKDATFSDPVFTSLKGDEPGKMWRMLCKRGKGMTVVVDDVQAHFVFKDGKILQHVDNFNLYKWARQALGLKGFCWAGCLRFRARFASKQPQGWPRSSHRTARMSTSTGQVAQPFIETK